MTKYFSIYSEADSKRYIASFLPSVDLINYSLSDSHHLEELTPELIRRDKQRFNFQLQQSIDHSGHSLAIDAAGNSL